MNLTDFTDYLKLEKNYSPNTVRAYLDDLKSFIEFLEKEFDTHDLKIVNYSMIRSWIVQLIENGIINRSVNRKISSLQAYYTFLLKTDQLAASPLRKHRSLKESKKVQIPFSRQEMDRFKEFPHPKGFEESRNRLIVELFYSTGIRRAELISIKTLDMQPGNKILKVRGKGNKERIIPVLDFVFGTLEKYLEERNQLKVISDPEYLFLTKKGKQIYPMLVYRIVKHYFSTISTKTKTSPHILRHTFATHLLNRGADINSIKTLLGHESLSSTQVYTHNDIARLRKIHSKTHPRNRGEDK